MADGLILKIAPKTRAGMIFRVDFKSGRPVYLQLVDQIKAAAASGRLRPGEPLPSIGALAAELRVGHNSIAKGYAELESLGIIELVPEKGYCLKEQHRPLRKAVARAPTSEAGSEARAPRRTFRNRLTHGLVLFPLAAAYLALVGLLAALLVRAGLVRGEPAAILITLLLAAVFLPLHRRIQGAVERRVFRKRHRVPRALQALKMQLSAEPDLALLMESVLQTAEAVMGVRPTLIRDRSEVASLVSSFPSLRWAREPVPAGNDFLMPLFSQDELLGVLHLKGKPAEQGYDPEDWEFLAGVGEQVAQVANQSRLRSEKVESEYALEIQRGLLPREIPQVPGFSIAGAWQPARNVGGDYYDVFRLGESRLALIVADVSGKGVPAALLMASLQASTQAYASMTSSPRELCERVNRAICGSVSPGRFITFFYGVLDAQQRTLTYTNAGHNPPLIASRDGTSRPLETGGAILGVFAEAGYEEETVRLADGDRLVIFTDGVVEATDAQGGEFGAEGLLTAMPSHAHASAGELRDAIMQAVTQFCGGDFADDATLLAVVADPRLEGERNVA